MFGSASVGYNHPYILEKSAWLGQNGGLQTYNVRCVFAGICRFCRNFGRVAIPKELPYCFCRRWRFAVENALKTAFDLENQKNWQKEAKPKVLWRFISNKLSTEEVVIP